MSRKTQIRKPLAIAIGAAMATTFGAATAAHADASPFAMTALGSAYLAADAGEGKCGEGKCGGAKSSDKDMFNAMDKDADGEITQAEFAAYWDGRFETWDQNMDDQLTDSEMQAGMKKHRDKGGERSGGSKEGGGKDVEHGGDKGDQWKKVTETMDMNDDAAVDRTEFTAYWDAKFRTLDADGDGRIDESELMAQHPRKDMEGDARTADAKTFLKEAGAGGKAEVEMAELALDRSDSEEVRALAQHIVEDHEAANQRLAEIAGEKGIEVPAELDPKHEEMKQELSNLSGEEFDQQYVQAQVQAHQNMIDLFERQADEGEDEKVREFAAVTLPTLEEHLDRAEELSAQLDR